MAGKRNIGISLLALTCWPGIGLTSAFAQLAQRPADEYIAAMDKPDRVLKVNEVIEKLRLTPVPPEVLEAHKQQVQETFLANPRISAQFPGKSHRVMP